MSGTHTDITQRKEAEKAIAIQRDLAVRLNAVNNLDQALTAIVKAALQIDSLEAGAIFLLDPRDGAPIRSYQQGLDQEFNRNLLMADVISLIKEEGGKPINLSIVDFSGRLPELAKGEPKWQAAAILPLLVGNRTGGFLLLLSRRQKYITEPSFKVLEAIAIQIGGAPGPPADGPRRWRMKSQPTQITIRTNTGWNCDRPILTADAFIDFNDLVCQQLGYSREEFAQLGIFDPRLQDDTPAIVDERMQKILQAGKIEFDTRHRTKSGSYIDVHVAVRIMTIAGQILLQAIWQDITSRKQAEKNAAGKRGALPYRD